MFSVIIPCAMNAVKRNKGEISGKKKPFARKNIQMRPVLNSSQEGYVFGKFYCLVRARSNMKHGYKVPVQSGIKEFFMVWKGMNLGVS